MEAGEGKRKGNGKPAITKTDRRGCFKSTNTISAMHTEIKQLQNTSNHSITPQHCKLICISQASIY